MVKLMKDKPVKQVGRPAIYTDETAEQICDLLAQGWTMKKICSLAHMPGITTVFKWEYENGEFAKLSARAREHGTHVLADQCLEIADDPSLDPADKRVRIDTRIRLIGKWNAKRYGDKIEHTVQQDFVPLDELRRRIEESKARRAALEAGDTITIEASKVVGAG
jgi:hypothetical protein